MNSIGILDKRAEVTAYSFYKHFSTAGFKKSVSDMLKRSDIGIEDIDFRPLPRKLAEEYLGEIKRSKKSIKKKGVFFGRFRYIKYDEKNVEGYELKAIHNGKPFDLNMESDGTIRMIDLSLAFYKLETSDSIYVIDEIDSSLHPDLVSFLIKKHLGPKSEKINSQLILSTHHISILDEQVIRPDEVWFTKKDSLGVSDIYPLSLFSPRNDKNLYKAYKSGLYGGKPNLDTRDCQ
jgi:AAA15 family ATPase/GTPase